MARSPDMDETLADWMTMHLATALYKEAHGLRICLGNG